MDYFTCHYVDHKGQIITRLSFKVGNKRGHSHNHKPHQVKQSKHEWNKIIKQDNSKSFCCFQILGLDLLSFSCFQNLGRYTCFIHTL